jgi:alkylation response protein AidB-like acyl-CoA dehydrogenase
MSFVDPNVPPDLSPRDRAVAERAAALAAELAASAAEHDRSGAFPHAHYRRLHEAGYIRLVLPRDHGGEGATLLQMVLAQERLAQGDAATAIGMGMLLNVMGRLAEEPAWPQPVWAHVCDTLARDGGIVNSVVTEPDLGSISRGGVPATTATPVPGGWQVTGHKSFVTAAPALRFLLTAVRLPPTPQAPQGEVARAIVQAPAAGCASRAPGPTRWPSAAAAATTPSSTASSCRTTLSSNARPSAAPPVRPPSTAGG